MTATITDKIMVASSGTRPNPTTLTAQKSVGASLLNADDLTGWGVSTPVTFVLYKIDTNGKEIVGTRTDWKGIVSGNTITQLVLTAGVDTIYPSGSPVVAVASARWGDDFTAAMLVSHNQNGTLKDNSVTNTSISDGAVSTSKYANTSVTSSKIDYSSGVWWEEIGRTTLVAAGDIISLTSIPPRKYLRVVVTVLNSGSTSNIMRFNNDSGVSYNYRTSGNGTETSVPSVTGIYGDAGANNILLEYDIVNIANQEKIIYGFTYAANIPGAASVPGRTSLAGKWTNTASAINRIDIINSGPGDMAIGSELIVLGHN